MATADCDLSPDKGDEPIYVIKGWSKSSRPYQVELQVNGQPLTMEVDTGATVSLAPESMLTSLLPTLRLQKSEAVLKTYTGSPIPVKGTVSVDVSYGQQHHPDLKSLVVGRTGPSLMGRDWL